MTVPLQAQSLQIFNEKSCVGYQSGFSLFHMYIDEQPQCKSLAGVYWLRFHFLYKYIHYPFANTYAFLIVTMLLIVMGF